MRLVGAETPNSPVVVEPRPNGVESVGSPCGVPIDGASSAVVPKACWTGRRGSKFITSTAMPRTIVYPTCVCCVAASRRAATASPMNLPETLIPRLLGNYVPARNRDRIVV